MATFNIGATFGETFFIYSLGDPGTPGHDRVLSKQQEKIVVKAITDKTPGQLKLPFALWIGQVIRRFGPRLLYGVDLETIDGVSTGTLAILMSELGTGEQILRNFRSGAAFASWLGLCPNNKITGGRIIHARTRKVAQALRMAEMGLSNGKSELGHYVSRMKGRLGKAEGITATAHKLARIIYALNQTRTPYCEKRAFQSSPKTPRRRLKNMQAAAAKMGCKLIPDQQLA